MFMQRSVVLCQTEEWQTHCFVRKMQEECRDKKKKLYMRFVD